MNLVTHESDGRLGRVLPVGRAHHRQRDVQEQAQSFSGVAAYYDAVPASIGAGGESKREWGQAATEGYFDVAQLKTAAGHGFAANEEHAPVIVLGYRL